MKYPQNTSIFESAKGLSQVNENITTLQPGQGQFRKRGNSKGPVVVELFRPATILVANVALTRERGISEGPLVVQMSVLVRCQFGNKCCSNPRQGRCEGHSFVRLLRSATILEANVGLNPKKGATAMAL